jgi:Fe-S-cluster containining protein
MDCRMSCGACCIAISISSPIPGMPQGKRAGERCLHLRADNLCGLFGKPELKTSGSTCGAGVALPKAKLVRG